MILLRMFHFYKKNNTKTENINFYSLLNCRDKALVASALRL